LSQAGLVNVYQHNALIDKVGVEFILTVIWGTDFRLRAASCELVVQALVNAQ
jgi:hypothetical protein